MKNLKSTLTACILVIAALAWMSGFLIGRTSPRLCSGCEHVSHGSETCRREVPCILGTVACTCQGMELKRKQLLLGKD